MKKLTKNGNFLKKNEKFVKIDKKRSFFDKKWPFFDKNQIKIWKEKFVKISPNFGTKKGGNLPTKMVIF